jgi:hypothetical protein
MKKDDSILGFGTSVVPPTYVLAEKSRGKICFKKYIKSPALLFFAFIT